MEPPRQKLFARFALIVFTALGLFYLWHLDYAKKISTNVIDLIPNDERSPELAMVRSLANDQQSRILLFALTSPRAPKAAPSEAAKRVLAELQKSSAIAEAVDMSDSSAKDILGKFIYDRRFDLLLPTWLERQEKAFAAMHKPASEYPAWLAEQVSNDLDHFLATPESAAFQTLVPNDPLLLVPSLVQQTQMLAAQGASVPGTVLLWARIADSPFAEAGQKPVVDAIERALASGRTITPDLKLEWTGVNRYAIESRDRIHREMSWLNTLSLVAVLAVACVFVRRIWKIIHLVPIVLLSVLGAWVVATASFERLHILVFVVGALLTGVAIDYGFYLYMQPALRPDEPYREKLGRLIKPLLASCLTTVIGFSLLLFSELPLIRQLGVFVSAGLLSALGAAIIYFAQLERPFLETRNFTLPGQYSTARWKHAIVIVALLVAVIGPWRLKWHDDIRELEIPSPALHAQDERLRSLFGDSANRSIYITRGPTPAEARAALDRFLTWHHEKFPESSAASIGFVLPTEANWLALPQRLAALQTFPAELQKALERHSYTPESFEPFLSAWETLRARAPLPSYASLVADLRAQLKGPLGLLFSAGENGNWFLVITDNPVTVEPPPELSTVAVNQLEKLNSLFTRYRSSALRLSIIGLSLVGASVFVLYGFRRGIRIFMIPAGSCFFAFGLLGLMGQTLNLFHLLGAFLGVCLSHNYAIFSAENATRREAPPPSIRVSALCTAVSFGVLALSKIPVVAALGSIVALIVLTALAMVELEPLGEKPANR